MTPQKLVVLFLSLTGGAIGLFAPVGVVKWLLQKEPEDAGILTLFFFPVWCVLLVLGLLIGCRLGLLLVGGKRGAAEITRTKIIPPSLNSFVHIPNRNVRRVDDFGDDIEGHVDLARLFGVGGNRPDVQGGANRAAVAQGYLRHAMADAGNSGAGGTGTRTDPERKRLDISECHCIPLISCGPGMTPCRIVDMTLPSHIASIQTATIVANVARPLRVQPAA
jgi:hypothetical protein